MHIRAGRVPSGSERRGQKSPSCSDSFIHLESSPKAVSAGKILDLYAIQVGVMPSAVLLSANIDALYQIL